MLRLDRRVARVGPRTPIWIDATSAQEAAYLEHWRQHALTEERVDGERLMQRECEEEERRQKEEDGRHACAGAARQAVQPAQQGDMVRAWEIAFPWAGPTPQLVDLAVGPLNDEDA